MVGMAIWFAVWSQSTPTYSGRPMQAFYSTDDGKTWFVDSVDRRTPFVKDGKEAVRAHIYQKNGMLFVLYLERLSPAGREAQKRMDNLTAKVPIGEHAAPPEMFTLSQAVQNGIEYKRPGDAVWRKSPPEVESGQDATPIRP